MSVHGAAGLAVGWYSKVSPVTRTASVATAASVIDLEKCAPSAVVGAPAPTARETDETEGADDSVTGTADTSPLRADSTPPVVEVSW